MRNRCRGLAGILKHGGVSPCLLEGPFASVPRMEGGVNLGLLQVLKENGMTVPSL
jgi:hypothetical protein